MWAGFALLAVAIGIVLLRACGLGLTALSWSFCPMISTALAAETARGHSLDAQAKQLELDLQRQRLACVAAIPPVEPLQLPDNPGPPSPQQVMAVPSPPPPLPADRWARKDLSLLDGCWGLGKETESRYRIAETGEIDVCIVHAGRVCFRGGTGQGQRDETMTCRKVGTIRCSAPINASFAPDTTLRTTQRESACTPRGVWASDPNALTCRRVSDTLAMCRSNAGFEYEFKRAQ